MLDTPKVEMDAFSAAIVDLVALVNQWPLRTRVIRDAKVKIDPALLRILAAVYRFEPVGVVELSIRAGRDHTTISRQVAKLQELGFTERRTSSTDRRVSELLLTAKGRRAAQALITAHHKVMKPILANWCDKDIADMTRLARRLIDELKPSRD